MSNKEVKFITGETIASKIREIKITKTALYLEAKRTGQVNQKLLDETMEMYTDLVNDLEFVIDKKGYGNDQ